MFYIDFTENPNTVSFLKTLLEIFSTADVSEVNIT